MGEVGKGEVRKGDQKVRKYLFPEICFGIRGDLFGYQRATELPDL